LMDDQFVPFFNPTICCWKTIMFYWNVLYQCAYSMYSILLTCGGGIHSVLAHPSVICFITIILMSMWTKERVACFNLTGSCRYYGAEITKK
jgi:hypothetical protein